MDQDLQFMVKCSGFRFYHSWFTVQSSFFMVQAPGFMVHGSWFRVQG